MSYEAWGEPDDSPYEAAIEAGWIDPTDLSKALIDVMNERDRQHNEEGWKPEHDDEHARGELAKAAACYAWAATVPQVFRDVGEWFDAVILRRLWPWDREWWKPSDPRRNLVKAGALILAEIERLDRAADKAAKAEGGA